MGKSNGVFFWEICNILYLFGDWNLPYFLLSLIHDVDELFLDLFIFLLLLFHLSYLLFLFLSVCSLGLTTSLASHILDETIILHFSSDFKMDINISKDIVV